MELVSTDHLSLHRVFIYRDVNIDEGTCNLPIDCLSYLFIFDSLLSIVLLQIPIHVDFFLSNILTNLLFSYHASRHIGI